jgi:hypothetical protein
MMGRRFHNILVACERLLGLDCVDSDGWDG